MAVLFTVARSADGSVLDGGCDDAVTHLTHDLEGSPSFEMNELPPHAYGVDARRLQLYSHPHLHPAVSSTNNLFFLTRDWILDFIENSK